MLRALLGILIAMSLTLPAVAEEAAPAKAADEAKPAAPAMDMSKMGPATRPVKNVKKVVKEIQAFLKKEDAAMNKHDLAATLDLIDFPVWMVTDKANDDGVAEVNSREVFEAMMKPFYDQPMPKGMKMSRKNAITPLSPSLALVVSTWTMKMGKKKSTWKSASVLLKKGGAWKSTAMIEAGWGDMPSGAPAAE